MNSAGFENGSPPDDGDWPVLTEGMEPYEQFRYIVRKLLEATIEDAQAYTLDERIFEGRNLEDEAEDEVRAHLQALDEALREDNKLTEIERAFLCEAVSASMGEHNMRARCYQDLLRFAQQRE